GGIIGWVTLRRLPPVLINGNRVLLRGSVRSRKPGSLVFRGGAPVPRGALLPRRNSERPVRRSALPSKSLLPKSRALLGDLLTGSRPLLLMPVLWVPVLWVRSIPIRMSSKRTWVRPPEPS